jgi:Cu(I)/Ag(I) efflux system membrane protein CusA/SilA
VADVQEAVETALGGRVATTTIEGRRRYPVRVRLSRDFREDEAAVANLPVAVPGGMAAGGDAAPETGGGMGGDAGAGI